MLLLSDIAQGLRSLVFPTACAGCGRPLPGNRDDLPVCASCSKELPWSSPPWCRPCGRSLARQGAGIETCADCRGKKWFFDQNFSLFLYEGLAKELILKFKYRGEVWLAPALGKFLGQRVTECLGPDPADLIAAVPLHATRQRERSFNQSSLLAKELSSRLHLPFFHHLLARTKPTLPQSQLLRQERLKNVGEAFGLQSDPIVRSARVLLVDDVFTTGSTVDSCARLLKKEAGAEKVFVVTLAHG